MLYAGIVRTLRGKKLIVKFEGIVRQDRRVGCPIQRFGFPYKKTQAVHHTGAQACVSLIMYSARSFAKRIKHAADFTVTGL